MYNRLKTDVHFNVLLRISKIIFYVFKNYLQSVVFFKYRWNSSINFVEDLEYIWSIGALFGDYM